jgi:hypothetical protein
MSRSNVSIIGKHLITNHSALLQATKLIFPWYRAYLKAFVDLDVDVQVTAVISLIVSTSQVMCLYHGP